MPIIKRIRMTGAPKMVPATGAAAHSKLLDPLSEQLLTASRIMMAEPRITMTVARPESAAVDTFLGFWGDVLRCSFMRQV